MAQHDQTSLTAYETYGNQSHFGALDGLRFLSILGVLFHHSPLANVFADSTRLAGRGFLGVDFFFLISGFLITTLLLRERNRTGKISLRGFYKRRILRIFPLYLLVVTAIGGYYVLVKQTPGNAGIWPFYYTFMANFLDSHISMLGPTWSLAVEEQYYMLWPLLLVFLPRRALLWIAGGYAVLYALVVQLGGAQLGWQVGPLSLVFGRLPYGAILLGAGLALLLDHKESFGRIWAVLGQRWSAPLAGLAVLAALLWLPVDLRGFSQLALHLVMAAFLGACVIREDTPLTPILRFAPIVRFGVVSYGIYLLHLLGYHVAREITERIAGDYRDHLLLFCGLYVALSWGMAEISFRFYERPFLALRHKPLGFLPRSGRTKPAKGKSLS